MLPTNFDMIKKIKGVLEDFFGHYFLNIIMNFNFFSDLVI